MPPQKSKLEDSNLITADPILYLPASGAVSHEGRVGLLAVDALPELAGAVVGDLGVVVDHEVDLGVGLGVGPEVGLVAQEHRRGEQHHVL